jgi:CubicO group peptidase (beta-lactamase class C family)
LAQRLILTLAVTGASAPALAADSASTSCANAAIPSSGPLPSAGTATPSPLAQELAAQPAIDPAALAEFVDGVVRGYMTEKGIAGVTVAVTNRNGPLLLRGYGIADEHPRREVDPGSTLFRIGSISKTFTYVAAMQLVAEHKLDLDAPVDRYLPPSLKTDSPRYPPIRVWHLMTHTAGFEDAALSAHMFYADPHKVPQLDAYLARYRPKRVRAPAVHANYSNYSVELLGAIVQQVSGEPFDEYIEKHILDPLGMRHTTFRELLPEGDPREVSAVLAGDFSTAFQFHNGGFAPRGSEYISNGAPAGAGSSDAADMAIWMRMLLNNGEVNGRQVLDPIAFHEMVTPTFCNASAVRAVAHGFFVGRYGRYASLEHDGDTLWFHSNMVVVPQAGIGMFVSTNTDTGTSLVEALPRLIFEHFLPGARPAPAPPPPKGFARLGQVYAGTYLSEKRNFSTIEKPLSTGIATIALTPDDYLVVNGGENGRFVEESPDIFREVDNSDRIQFLRDARGRVTGMAVANGHAVFGKAGFFDNPHTALGTLALLWLVCLCALVGAWGRRGRPLHENPALRRDAFVPAGTLLLAVCGWLLFLILMISAIVVMSTAGYKLLFDFPPPILLAMVVLGYVASVLTLIALWFLPRVWKLQAWRFWRKLRHSLVLALMVWTIVLLIEWKVLLAPLKL